MAASHTELLLNLSAGWDRRHSSQENGRRFTILIADGSEVSRCLLRGMIKSPHYRILEAGRATEAFALLEREHVDLVIVDLFLPEVSGPDFCWRLKSDRQTHLIPIIMLTSVHGVENEIQGLNSGADEFLSKPLHPAVVRTRVRAMLRNKAAIDTLEEAETILFALARAIEQRDRCTSGHCERLAALSVALGRAIGLSTADLMALHRGGYLHDIGKVAIPDAILFKPGPLTSEEWEIMQTHTIRGEEICRHMKTLASVLPIVRNHHERWDGSGYPDHLKGDRIPLLARILQLVDIYDALTTPRPYKRAYSHEEAVQVLEGEARRGWRDPELLLVFKQVATNWINHTPSDAHFAASDISDSLANMRRALQDSK
jgi:putative two-component system response regulator